MAAIIAFIVLLIIIVIYLFANLYQRRSQQRSIEGRGEGSKTSIKSEDVFVELLAVEYRRWCFSKELIERDTHERYVIGITGIMSSMARENCRDKNPRDPIYRIMPENAEPYMSFIDYSKNPAEVPIIKKLIDNFIEKPPRLIYHEIEQIDNIYKYGEFKRYLRPDREVLLKIAAADYGLDDEHITIAITILLMRYDIYSEFGSWNIPRAVYDVLFNAGFMMEGFASPLDSQLLGRAPYVKYCSVFPDTDKYFGSQGPIEFVNLKNTAVYDAKANKQGLVLAPPWAKGISPVADLIYRNITALGIPCIYFEIFPKVMDQEDIKKGCINADEPFDWHLENSMKHKQTVKFEFLSANDFCIHCNSPAIWEKIRDKVQDRFKIIIDYNDPEYVLLNEKVKREFSRWQCIQRILALANDVEGAPAAFAQTWRETVKWLLSEMSKRSRDMNWVDYVFVDNAQDLYSQMYSMMNSYTMVKSADMINEAINHISDWIEKTSYEDVKYGYYRKGYICKTEDTAPKFEVFIGHKHQQNLLSLLHMNGYTKYENIIMIIMLLRYDCLLTTIPKKFFENAKEIRKLAQDGAYIENAISPLFAQLPLVDPRTKLCTQFYDTDYYFGSLGKISALSLKSLYLLRNCPGAKVNIIANSVTFDDKLLAKWRAECKKYKLKLKLSLIKDNDNIKTILL